MPATINKYLRDYQRDGVSFLFRQYAQGHGGILGDDMVCFLCTAIRDLLVHVHWTCSMQRCTPHLLDGIGLCAHILCPTLCPHCCCMHKIGCLQQCLSVAYEAGNYTDEPICINKRYHACVVYINLVDVVACRAWGRLCRPLPSVQPC